MFFTLGGEGYQNTFLWEELLKHFFLLKYEDQSGDFAVWVETLSRSFRGKTGYLKSFVWGEGQSCVTVVPLLCNSRDSQTRNVLNVAVWWPGQLCQYMTVICFDSWVIFHNCQLFARCESWSNNLILLVVEICDNNDSCISDSSENMSLLLLPVTVLSNILHLFQCFSCKNIDSCVHTWQLLCRCLTVHVQICDCQADM